MSNSADLPPQGAVPPTEKIRDVIAGWIETVTTQGERAIDSLGLRGPGKPWIPSVDLVESPEQIIVLIDLPGVDPARIEILLVGNMLTVKGEQSVTWPQIARTVHRRERPAGGFSRSIPLPAPVVPENVVAESRHGVLTVTLAKEVRSQARPIPVTVRTSTT
ncbi:MAG: Hsp20/alpha crystallin family protein [Planctomycetes bacterium]|nr:Hsp20/alpha crystallin family protein [Planctomycetota bacterium]